MDDDPPGASFVVQSKTHGFAGSNGLPNVKNMINDLIFLGWQGSVASMGFVTGAIAELYVNEYARLKRIVSRILSRPDVADDVIQDTFLKLSDRELQACDRGLLVRAAQNMARDYNRLEKNRTTLAEKAHGSQIAGEPVSPEKSAVVNDQLQSLFQAIHSMPRRRAQIFLLAKLDEMPYARIAEELGVSLSTVEKEMAAAMAFCHKWQRDHDFP